MRYINWLFILAILLNIFTLANATGELKTTCKKKPAAFNCYARDKTIYHTNMQGIQYILDFSIIKQDEFVLSDNMTLSQVEQAMKLFPPKFKYGEQRLQIMESLVEIEKHLIKKCLWLFFGERISC